MDCESSDVFQRAANSCATLLFLFEILRVFFNSLKKNRRLSFIFCRLSSAFQISLSRLILWAIVSLDKDNILKLWIACHRQIAHESLSWSEFTLCFRAGTQPANRHPTGRLGAGWVGLGWTFQPAGRDRFFTGWTRKRKWLLFGDFQCKFDGDNAFQIWRNTFSHETMSFFLISYY